MKVSSEEGKRAHRDRKRSSAWRRGGETKDRADGIGRNNKAKPWDSRYPPTTTGQTETFTHPCPRHIIGLPSLYPPPLSLSSSSPNLFRYTTPLLVVRQLSAPLPPISCRLQIPLPYSSTSPLPRVP